KVRWRVRMSEFLNALVNRVSRTNAKNENSCDERPEKPFFAIAKRMFLGGGPFVEPQTQQQKDLVCGVSDRVKSLGHHAGRPGYDRSDELQYGDQSVGKERADYGQHT